MSQSTITDTSSIEDVKAWIKSLEFSENVVNALFKQEVDGETLFELTRERLISPPYNFTYGVASKLIHNIDQLQPTLQEPQYELNLLKRFRSDLIKEITKGLIDNYCFISPTKESSVQLYNNNLEIIPPDLIQRFSDQVDFTKSFKFVAKGMSSSVYSVLETHEQHDLLTIVKIYNNVVYKDTELQALTKLSHLPCIPTIKADGLTWILIQPFGQLIRENIHPWSHYQKLLKTIVDAHTIGIVHRDIRPSNIVVADGHPYLIDWASSVTINSTSPYEGTFYTASSQVLISLSNGSHHQSTSIDDLVSFVKTFLVIRLCLVDDEIHSVQRDDPLSLDECWRDLETTILDPLSFDVDYLIDRHQNEERIEEDDGGVSNEDRGDRL
ncbi:hypothetical protein DFA_04160 [Cavenderia fasciculata]|uniref:non-specific serine/threonine protein kinase n=1 Tax=Cavenderia fasciculata TaxID=261658 RepID=F4Q1G3_CACFS|nr:uncharacterized protein DFA_04160 [Cavenderia fasciculata]EGG18664.1 hypothetical protein DFA_04160 [Cavenderia fasciculata]|eukprot:XP_004366568.1 hypothetical protein DFA_04160 [Cavenderia fasciculata]